MNISRYFCFSKQTTKKYLIISLYLFTMIKFVVFFLKKITVFQYLKEFYQIILSVLQKTIF